MDGLCISGKSVTGQQGQQIIPDSVIVSQNNNLQIVMAKERTDQVIKNAEAA